MKKVSNFIDFISFLTEVEKGYLKAKSLENVLFSLRSKNSEYEEKIFAVPIWGNDNVAVITPNILPNPLEKLSEAEYTISIMTISHFNFSFMIFNEMYVLTDD